MSKADFSQTHEKPFNFIIVLCFGGTGKCDKAVHKLKWDCSLGKNVLN